MIVFRKLPHIPAISSYTLFTGYCVFLVLLEACFFTIFCHIYLSGPWELVGPHHLYKSCGWKCLLKLLLIICCTFHRTCLFTNSLVFGEKRARGEHCCLQKHISSFWAQMFFRFYSHFRRNKKSVWSVNSPGPIKSYFSSNLLKDFGMLHSIKLMYCLLKCQSYHVLTQDNSLRPNTRCGARPHLGNK